MDVFHNTVSLLLVCRTKSVLLGDSSGCCFSNSGTAFWSLLQPLLSSQLLLTSQLLLLSQLALVTDSAPVDAAGAVVTGKTN
jgi:hypothetical protein